MQTCLKLALLIMCVLHSSSSEQASSNATSVGKPMYCYQCNSAEAYEGPGCDPEVITQKFTDSFYHKCPSDALYTRCRKMVQTVDGETRVVRSCATEGKLGDKDRCIDRVGTAKIKIKYCECVNSDEKTACNSSPNQNTVATSLMLISAFFSSLFAVRKVL